MAIAATRQPGSATVGVAGAFAIRLTDQALGATARVTSARAIVLADLSRLPAGITPLAWIEVTDASAVVAGFADVTGGSAAPQEGERRLQG